MSSAIRSVRSLKKPDQNTSYKVTTLLYDLDNYSWPKFECTDGVYELTGDSKGYSIDNIIDDADDEDIYGTGLVNCKYSGGLRVITSFGPNMKEFLRALLQYGLETNLEVNVTKPGQSSRIQILRKNNNNMAAYGDNPPNAYLEETNAPQIPIASANGWPNYYSNWAAPDANLSTWIVKEPVLFTIDGDEYMLFNPLGDDVYAGLDTAFNTQQYPYSDGRSIGGSSHSILKYIAPRNKGAQKKMTALVKKINEKKAAVKAKRAADKAAKAAAKAATAAAAAAPEPAAAVAPEPAPSA